MNSQHATSDEIRQVVGEIDDLVIERIENTGASTGEISEALARFEAGENGEALVDEVSSPRVLEVRAILAETLRDDDDDSAGDVVHP